MGDRREWWIVIPDGQQNKRFAYNNPVRKLDDAESVVHVREVLPGDLDMLNGYEPLVNKLESLEEQNAKLVERLRKTITGRMTVSSGEIHLILNELEAEVECDRN